MAARALLGACATVAAMATATAFFASDADRAQLIAQPEQFVARAETVLGGLVERLKRLEAERAAERVDAEQVHHQHERAHATLRDEHQKRVQQTQQELIRNYDDLGRCLRGAGHAYSQLLTTRRPVSGMLPHDSAALCPAQQ